MIRTPCDVRLLDEAMDADQAQAAFSAKHAQAGAIASFVGKVRDDGDTQALELTHYVR